MKTILTIITVLVLSLVSADAMSQGMTVAEKGDMVHSITLPVMEVHLKPGPGLDKVSTLCNICHTLKYITMQPPFPRAKWTAIVDKMITVMGAPINKEDAKTIINYLSAEYGNGK